MRRFFAPLLLAASLLVPAGAAQAAQPSDPGTPSGRLDASGRYVVVTRAGAKVGAVRSRHARDEALKTDRIFTKAVRGFAGRMSARQVAALRADPDVVAVVPDEVVNVTRTTPTGVIRIGGLTSPLARIDTVDERIDADVAVVDTGIDPTNADLNVRGGYNCTSANPANWKDWHSHGTHVAGTIGAIDNSRGVVGVAPGVRLWAVRILNAEGYGYLSWYICGLDWIAAQRDPVDPSRPLIEAVNMSVTKWGIDDTNCGFSNNDPLHQAVCRVTQAGITVVAAAANDSGPASRRVPASYNEVITVSALADTDGRPGGTGGRRCYSWGTYDSDDTFADFSNYGYDVDLIAPGKCILSTLPGGAYGYMSGTSMAAPHVTGAVALYKSTRPWATPLQIKAALQAAGNQNWKTWTDPDRTHERLLDVSRISTFGDFSLRQPADGIGEAGGTARMPVRIDRTSTHFEPVRFSGRGPSGWSATFSPTPLAGFNAEGTTMTVRIPSGTAEGRYPVVVTATDGQNIHQRTVQVTVTRDEPTAHAPSVSLATKLMIGTSSVPIRLSWAAATDPTSPIGGYETQLSIDGGSFGSTVAIRPATSTVRSVPTGHSFRFRIRARDIAGNWSNWVPGSTRTVAVRDERSTAVTFSSGWSKGSAAYAYRNTVRYTTRRGAWVETRVTGRHVGLVAPIGPTRGQVKVYVNGVYKATVNLYSPTGASRRLMWQATYSAVATRTVRFVVVGTAGHPRVDVDAFVFGT